MGVKVVTFEIFLDEFEIYQNSLKTDLKIDNELFLYIFLFHFLQCANEGY